MTMILSAGRTVDSRWAIRMTVMPNARCSSAILSMRSDSEELSSALVPSSMTRMEAFRTLQTEKTRSCQSERILKAQRADRDSQSSSDSDPLPLTTTQHTRPRTRNDRVDPVRQPRDKIPRLSLLQSVLAEFPDDLVVASVERSLVGRTGQTSRDVVEDRARRELRVLRDDGDLLTEEGDP